MRRTLLAAALAATLAGAGVLLAPATAAAGPTTDVIVRFNFSVGDPAALARGHIDRHGGSLRGVYQHALKGFAASLPAAAIRALRNNPLVEAVEPDGQMSIVGNPMPWGSWPEFDNPAAQAQTVPTGIARIFADENPNLRINGQVDYVPDVDIVIFDTGIDYDHPDLNVVGRVDCTSGTCREGQGDDGHGHGSHVAGTAAAIDNGIGVVGVAPGARLTAVKVLDNNGSGNWSWYVAGVDWVTARANVYDVTNASLGGTGAPSSLETAINNSVAKGIVHTVAAGNNDRDASGYQPAGYESVITVSALADFNGEPGGGAGSTCRADQDDTLADFSNWGSEIEIAAPGVCINSTFKDGGYQSNYSGTSMAAPHVTGATALYASVNKPTNQEQVFALRDYLRDTGNFNWTDDSGDGVKEPLLDVGNPDRWPPAPPDPGKPTASFTASCSEQNTTCSFDGSASSDPDGTIQSWAWDFGDGSTGSGETTSHTYAESGTYTITLTVTDNDGKTASTSRTVQAGPPPPNAAPTARFTSDCKAYPSINFRYCIFDGRSSSDPDGSISTWAWNFGDGTTGSGDQVYHRYAAAGSYTVTLTVTDDRGATHSVSRSVTVP